MPASPVRLSLLLCPVLLALSATAFAQVNLERFERQLEQIQRDTRVRINEGVPAQQRLLIDYGGSIAQQFITIDDLLQDNHVLNQTILTLYARVDLDGVHQFFIRGSTKFKDWYDEGAFDGDDSEWVGPDLERAVYRFDLQRALGAYEGQVVPYNMVINAGRQLVHWANGLTLSSEIDGGLITFSYAPVHLDLLVGRTRQDSFDFDSSRPDSNDDTRRHFYGGMLRWQATERHQPYIYGLYQEDRNKDETAAFTAAATAYTNQFHYQSWYLGAGSQGSITDNLLYGLEFVYEGGESLSRPFDTPGGAQIPQTRDSIEAFAASFRLDYLQPASANRTRYSAEILAASGDEDRLRTSSTSLGNQAGTTDHAFNGFGLINTGFAFGAAPSNLLMLRLGAATLPFPTSNTFKRLQVGTNVFFFSKLIGEAGIDEPSNNNSFLGSEIDLYANWQITSDISLAVRYGVFFPGAGLGDPNQTISTDDSETNNHPRHFFFTGLTYAF